MRRSCDGLAWPAVAWTLLLACAAASAVELAPGICQTVDIRNFAREMQKLRGCRVIEGQLSIVLLERATKKDFENVTFPELREVTGYVKIYRMKGVLNLGDLFPNLSVIRGMQLFKDFAVVIFDSEDIEMLGLRSLTTIERGAVRIQNNDQLCYANTIDWDRIIQDGSAVNNLIRSNYDTRLCGLCPNAQSRMEDHRQSLQCPSDPMTGRLLCWDDNHCQKICPMECGDRPCMPNGTCCNEACLGGCDGPGPGHCHVCRNFSLGHGNDRKCMKSCPAGLYEVECRAMPPPVFPRADPNPPNIKAYKILNNQCVWTCPNGYMEKGDKRTSTCIRCPPSGCTRECVARKIDSVASAEQYRGCTHVTGVLEISIRASGGNTMAILEASLGEIRKIRGTLKVTRSNPLVSLMFLKNLEEIVAIPDEQKGQSLHIFNNPNLELLWDWSNHRPIRIEGHLYIHFNPKLCYSQIEPLKSIMHKNFSDTEVSEDNNGDQASCYQTKLLLKVHVLHKNVVILTWDSYCVPDTRKLLGYSIYYIPAEQNVTLYGQRDACSDSWNVVDVPPGEAKRNSSASTEEPKSKYLFGDPCGDVQPLFYPVTQLTPFTRYAAYVKTFTTLQDKKFAQSSIIYFKTLPGRPSPPVGVSVELRGPHNVSIKWSPPAMPNGTINKYHVEIQANSYNRDKIISGYTNYCGNPNALANLIAVRGEDMPERQEEKAANELKNGTCACSKEEAKSATRFNSRAEEERWESIEFENELQNEQIAGEDMPERQEEKAANELKNGTCACSKEEAKSATRFNSRAEEERWESIEFENELQNEVYVKMEKNRTKSTKGEQSRRTRRSIDHGLNSMLVILSGNNSPALDKNYTNATEEGYVKSQYYVLDGSSRSLTVTNMRHFTWYTVNVWACRERQPNETDSAYEETWCSERSYNTFRTMEEQNADVVVNVHAETLPSNKSLPEVNVTWEPPVNPNGFVVGYNVHYSRVEDSSQTTDVGLQSCVQASECGETSCSTVLRTLLPGRYNIRVTPVTVSGAGNASAEAIVEVPAADAGSEWIWGAVGGCVVMVMVLGVAVWYAKRSFLPPTEANKLFASVNPEYVSTVYVPDEWEVPRNNIQFIRELGQGSFGMVYEGLAKGLQKDKPETRCAVKTVNEHATDRERIEFLNEASVMKAFDTFHVVRLMGVVSRGQPTLVVMELMEQGDLKTYLRSHRPDSESSLPKKDSNNPPTLQNILQMAIEIADGMAYLSAKKFVHRDLAARNCMVAGDLTVKVGDFGMTRDIYETDYYRKGTKGLLPVRWMSPESLKDGVFSSNSDVWSYGVVLWEMATLAMQPYQGLSNEQVVRYVVEGGVMERPEHCPDRLYELMRACWSHRPSSRPSFLQLVADLASSSQPHFRQRSFFHSAHGQEIYKLQRSTMDEEQELTEVNVGAVASGSGSNLFGVSGRLASWVRELSSLRSRASDDAAAEPLQPAPRPLALKSGPNGVIRDPDPASTGC